MCHLFIRAISLNVKNNAVYGESKVIMITRKTIPLFTLGFILALSACKKAEDAPKENAAEAPKAEVNPTDSQTPDAPPVKVQMPPAPRITQSNICPQKATKTKDGICSCMHGGLDSLLPLINSLKAPLQLDGSDVLGDEFECTITREEDSNDFGTAAVCTKLRGCMTLDGRWYPALSKTALTHHRNEGGATPHYTTDNGLLANRFTSRSAPYYVPGGMDITLESVSELGDCVLDRTDGIPLLSALD